MATRGRPRAFDRDEALRRAMDIFWRRGYEGTSVDDLTAAMGIGKRSLYLAFRCKEELFREAVALYTAVQGAATMGELETAATARAGVEGLLRANVRMFGDPGSPPGCMIVNTALLGRPESAPVSDHLVAQRRAGQQAVRRRLAQGVTDGDVPAGTDLDAVAAFYTTVLHGLSIYARDGASAGELGQVVDAAMAAWDTLAPRP
ncbi:TetR family transcriptional regulator [Sphaerisporangium rufum]|uniref:TetR family transcriptional regulator n=1 Tax=Sphaerisporangium rufum TaxID=1381558 RepID=A0A919RC83_9ACTN|nr:TetR/AcrR family transcriptional regulator [Sphaerisporangium rufum]GII81307.1 TetR family transcriptional regulator [Sphaerisporangium rufum]